MVHKSANRTPQLVSSSLNMRNNLLLILLLSIVTAGLRLSGGSLLAANATWATTSEWRVEGKVDVLLGVETDNEGWDVDDLLSDADVALADQDTGVVDGLGEAELVDAGLEATLEEILDLEGQDVIELHAGLVKDTDANETANESVTLEETLWVLLVQGQELTVGEVSMRFFPSLRQEFVCVCERTGQHDGSWRG